MQATKYSDSLSASESLYFFELNYHSYVTEVIYEGEIWEF